MIYNLSQVKHVEKYKSDVGFNIKRRGIVEMKDVKKDISALQHKSLHLFFYMVSEELNNIGIEYIYYDIEGLQISIPYTKDLFKEFYWKPIQFDLFKIKSTKKISHNQLNTIIDILTKFFGEKGVVITFPNIEELKIKNKEKEGSL